MPGRGNVRGLWARIVKLLFGLSKTTETPASAEYHPSCLVGDGSTVYMESASLADFTIADSGWTVMVWTMPFDNLTDATHGLVELLPADGHNGMNILHVDSGGTEKIRSTIFDEVSGSGLHDVDGIGVAIYNQVVVSRGTNDKIYVNGYLGYNAAASGSLSNEDRKLTIGAQAGGTNPATARIHSVAIWNTELSADEVASIFANGCGYAAQLDKDFDSYTSSSNLIHWYRLGLDITTPGKDHAGSNDLTAGSFADTDFILNGPGNGALYLTTTPEYLANTTTQDVGFGNAWSFILNFRPITGGASRHFFTIGPATNENVIKLYQGASNDFVIELYNSSGTLFKQYTFGDMSRTQERRCIGGTWDGTTLTLYEGGYAITPTTTPTDNSDSQTQTNRAVRINVDASAANGGDHTYRSLAFWNKALSANEMEALWYDGGYDVVDLRKNFHAYSSGSNLKHWWVMVPALTTEEGTDYVADKVDSGGIDLSANAVNVTGLDDHFSWPIGGKSGSTALAPGACVFFDSAKDHRLETSTQQDLSVANSYTIAAWVRPQTGSLGSTNHFFHLDNETNNVNRIAVYIAGGLANDPLRYEAYDSSGTQKKDWRWGHDETDVDTWVFAVVTWDGSTVHVYANGDEDTAPTKTIDNTMTQTNTNRSIGIGARPGNTANEFNGWLGPAFLWNTVLTADEIRYMYRMGYHFDPLTNNGDYSSASGLVGAWRPGAKDIGDIGHDYSGNGFDLDEEINFDGTERRQFGPAAGTASGS